MPAAKSCPSCGTKKKCNRAHVYAVELDSEVLNDKKFVRKTGVPEDFEGRCFYVGKTSAHRVECRYKQHRVKKKTLHKEGATFDCCCKTGRVEKIKYHWSNRGNSWVRRWGRGLAYDLFAHWNPLPKKVCATTAEAELAQSLREAGHAVYTDAILETKVQ